MDRVAVVVGLCLLVGMTLGGQPAAGATAPPDDYEDDNCRDAREVSANGTTSGQLDTGGDRDKFTIPVENGDVFYVELSADASVNDFTMATYMVGSDWRGSVVADRNARLRTEWGLGAVLEDSSRPGYAKILVTIDDTMCLAISDNPDDGSTYPADWTLRIAKNRKPAWYHEAGTPTPTATPTRTSTPRQSTTVTATPTPTPTPTPVPPTESGDDRADSDGDGVVDRNDYAPRDSRVQAAADVQLVTPTPSGSSGFGPGFGPGTTIVALLSLAAGSLLVRQR